MTRVAFYMLAIPVQNCQRTTADDEGFDCADKKFDAASALLFFFFSFSAHFNVSPARSSCFFDVFVFFQPTLNNVH